MNAEQERKVWTIGCVPCGNKFVPATGRDMADATARHQAGHDTEAANDKAAAVQGRYMERQAEVLRALRSAVELCGRGNSPHYIQREAAEWRKLLALIQGEDA